MTICRCYWIQITTQQQRVRGQRQHLGLSDDKIMKNDRNDDDDDNGGAGTTMMVIVQEAITLLQQLLFRSFALLHLPIPTTTPKVKHARQPFASLLTPTCPSLPSAARPSAQLLQPPPVVRGCQWNQSETTREFVKKTLFLPSLPPCLRHWSRRA